MLTLPLRAMGALACLALPAFAAEPAKPSDIPVESFFRRAEFTQMTLAPDGQKLAAIVPRQGRGNLVVIDLEKGTRNVITNFSSVDVVRAYWADYQRLCMRVADGQEVTVRSRRGAIRLPARASAAVSPGSVFIPFHFREAAANVLTTDALDPHGKIPEFKFCAVRIEA